MDRTRRRAFAYIGLFIAAILFYTLAYKYGMQFFEGESRTFLQSFQIVIETFTTTGYGEDAPWQAPQMLALVVVMQLSGVFLIFLTLPLFVMPWVEKRMEIQPPTAYDGNHHVVICGFSERSDALIDELEAQEVEYVVVVPDRQRARRLQEDGYSVVAGDPEMTETLTEASVSQARAVVLDNGDEANATIALSVREITDTVRVVAFIDDSDLAPYLELAGADDVLLPRDLLGRGLADKVTSVITTKLGETVDIGADIEIIELPLQKGCDLDGVTIQDSGFRERTGANIIGAWIHGRFVPSLDPETVLDRNTVLLVSGEVSQLEAAMDLTSAPGRTVTRDVIIAGYGEVGSEVAESLAAVHIGCTIIDLDDGEDVDIVGDATSESVLKEAGIDDAGVLIVSIGDDTEAVFTTLVAREANPEVEIIARVNETESTSKLYAAGADYVLALSTVSGRMLAASILDEDVISLETQIDIVRTEAPKFTGQTLAEAEIRARTGCTVIAVDRDETIHTELGPDFVIQRGDSLVLAGADENIALFHEKAGVRPGGE